MSSLSSAALASVVFSPACAKDEGAAPAPSDMVDVRRFGATGNATTDDTLSIQEAIKAAKKVAGRSVYFPPGTYLLTSPIEIPSDIRVFGSGSASILKAAAPDFHMLTCNMSHNIVIDSLHLVGMHGSAVLSNSAILLNKCSNCFVRNCEIVGSSGMALRVTQSDHIVIEHNYIHDLTADDLPVNQNSADIGLYSNTSHCIVRNNRCMGGSHTWIGISILLNGTNHIVDGNEVGPHYAYGILDYDVSYVVTNNVITNNYVSGIDGRALDGISGAGIYVHCTGGQTIAGNHIAYTNLNTSAETLAPGAIGINAPSTTVTIENNTISDAAWYGIYSAATEQPLIVRGNIVRRASRDGIFLKETSNATLDGNSIVQRLQDSRCIGINVTGSNGPFKNVSVRNNKTMGGSNSIEVQHTNALLIGGNDISQCCADGITLRAGDGAVVYGNSVTATGADNSRALIIGDFANCSVVGNVLASSSGTVLYLTGACLGTHVATSNAIVQQTPSSVLNASVGGTVSSVLPSPRTTYSAAGDHVRNSAARPGEPKGWYCVTSGLPGKWITEGNL